ncbi:carbohydrate kinase [Knoellia sp. 3-2P3]|uniref:carbohydrate kinase family protein n=1 Tax=unclassified Knoellia TaxID=2618719 RepID=UPI0023DB2FB0|nr:carbohydrate kinase [Knoellia sp. 3-2P3]MDF2093313.1 carbohydrate kinase [Knoellia sp. 3-2P3]
MSERVLVIGEALIDRVSDADGDVVEHPGGSPANVAVGLARLDHHVDFATRLGGDERGTRIANHLTRHGVSLLRTTTGKHPTSVAEARLDAAGAAEYTFDLHWDLPHVDIPAKVGHVHTGSIAAILEPGARSVLAALGAAREHATVSYDPNIRPDIMGDLDLVRERVEELIALADVVKASEDDLLLLYPGSPVSEVLRRWGTLGPTLVVVTRGPHGVVFGLSTTGEVASAPTRAETVVDTVGAGDSFMAGLLSGLASAGLTGAEGRKRLAQATLAEVRPAVDRALACAAATVARAGAYAPSLDEL